MNEFDNNDRPRPGQPLPPSIPPSSIPDSSLECPLPAQQQYTIQLLEKLLEQALAGDVVSLAYVAETIDDSYEGGFTGASGDRFGRFGYMIYTALRTLGIKSEDIVGRDPSE